MVRWRTSKTMRPAALPPMVMSKKTRGLDMLMRCRCSDNKKIGCTVRVPSNTPRPACRYLSSVDNGQPTDNHPAAYFSDF